ncbi:hypothetical protein ACWDRR_27470 [Kitasatospora sp. NPDC003701]
MDQNAGQFRVTVRDEPMSVLAEAWLIARGADPEQLRERIQPSEFNAADAETAAAEDLLRHAGTRFDVHDSASPADTPFVTWVIAADREAPDAARPVAVFVGHRQPDTEAFTLRIGHFADIEDAYSWTRNPFAPLPQPGRPGDARTDAARLDRRPRTQHGPAAPGDQPAQAAGPTQPTPGAARHR